MQKKKNIVKLTQYQSLSNMGQIFGELFTPVFTEGYRRSRIFVDNEFYSEYQKHIAALENIGACAKLFVLNNWDKIEDWSKLNITIHDNTQTSTHYYNHTSSDRKNWGKNTGVQEMLIKKEERRARKHNPIISLTDIVLDPSDGDFSLKINGNDHLWIDDESVVIIADYIEKNLNTNKKT